MRKALQKEEGERKKFYAIFERLGKKINYLGHSEETILLTKITDVESNKILADHLWFTFSKSFQKAALTEGCQLEFEARVTKYKKGYVNKQYKIDNRRTDFKLNNPTKIKRRLG